MGFKLVRVDATEPYKVSLPLGSHFIGRGKFLDCKDTRISRNHAELIVTSESVLLKSLHQNPCFLKKKSSTETIIFSQPESQVLSNGDQFGLVPDSFWYEVINCTENANAECTESKDVTKDCITGNTQLYNLEEGMLDCTESLLDGMMQPFESSNQPVETTNLPVETTNQPVETTNQPVPTTNQPVGTTNQPVESTNVPVESTNVPVESTNVPVESTNVPVESETATKRLHFEESPANVKRVKTEPEESPSKDPKDEAKQMCTPGASNQVVKTEPGNPQDAKPGPSNDRGSPSNNGPGCSTAMPPSPNKPPNKPLRERCMYGANCYRRNPQHKAQFSHPTDADWGSGERGVCPWGASCQKADPRHWHNHDHPPGVHPPSARPHGNRPGMQVFRRHGINFYINANSVHFYDDHFQVEDSDGDSVDYDYEF